MLMPHVTFICKKALHPPTTISFGTRFFILRIAFILYLFINWKYDAHFKVQGLKSKKVTLGREYGIFPCNVFWWSIMFSWVNLMLLSSFLTFLSSQNYVFAPQHTPNFVLLAQNRPFPSNCDLKWLKVAISSHCKSQLLGNGIF